MKQIYNALDWLGDYYNYIIFNIFILSILILVLNNNESVTLWKFYDSQEDYDVGNGIWNNILTGLIGSAFFYWIVQYFPEKRRQKRILKSIDKHLFIIRNSINYEIQSNVERYKLSGIEELFKVDKFLSNDRKDIVNQIKNLVSVGDLIESQLNIINNSNPIHLLEDYDSAFINLYYKSSFVMIKQTYKAYLLSIEEDNLYQTQFLEFFISKRLGKDLKSLHDYSDNLKKVNFISSASK